MLHLSRNPEEINAVINHPSVRPYVGAPDAGYLDSAPWVEDFNHLFPFGEHGGFALLKSAPATYEVHAFIKPEGRGAWGFEATNEMIDMAAQNGAQTMWARVFHDRPDVKFLARSVGFRPNGVTLCEMGGPHDIYEVRIH